MKYPRTPEDKKLNRKVSEEDKGMMRTLYDAGINIQQLSKDSGYARHTVLRWVDPKKYFAMKKKWKKWDWRKNKRIKEHARRARARKKLIMGDKLRAYQKWSYLNIKRKVSNFLRKLAKLFSRIAWVLAKPSKQLLRQKKQGRSGRS